MLQKPEKELLAFFPKSLGPVLWDSIAMTQKQRPSSSDALYFGADTWNG